jgi:hypothetical protein
MSVSVLVPVARIWFSLFFVLVVTGCMTIPEKSISLVAADAKRDQVAIIRGHNLVEVGDAPIPKDTGTVVVKPGTYKIYYGDQNYTYSLILKAQAGRTYLLTNKYNTDGKGRYYVKDVTSDPNQHENSIPPFRNNR